MFLTYLINAVIGAFIGFITNYLAIKMLFKPDKPVYIGRFRVPFTPGIIPKEKVRLAKSVGTVVGNKLFTSDVLEKALKDENITQGMDKLINETVAGFEQSPSTIRDTLKLFIKDSEEIDGIACEAVSKYCKSVVRSEETKSVLKHLLNRLIAEFLATPIKSFDNQVHFTEWTDKGIGFLMNLIKNEGFIGKLEQQVVHLIEKGSNNASPLSNYLPDTFFESVKNAVSNNTDRIGDLVTDLLNNPQIEKNVVEILNGLMDASVTTRVINVFVSKDAVYKRIKEKIQKYLKSEKGRQELARAIHQHIDKLKTTSVGEIVSHANREDVYHISGSMIRLAVENCLDAKFDEMLSNQIRKYLADNPDITIGKLLEPLTKGETVYEKFVEDILEYVLQNLADKWMDEVTRLVVPKLLDQKIARFADLLKGYGENITRSLSSILFSFVVPRAGDIIKALNIPKLITDKVNEYDITELEEMILSIIDRELKVIILLGAVFGSIIGLAGPVISGFLM